jgi:hypothetical protein
MALEYKDIKLELPPFGKLVVIKYDKDKPISGDMKIGYFYVNRFGERRFMTKFLASCYGSDYNGFKDCLWAYLPEFISIEDQKPPVGKEVVAISEETRVDNVKANTEEFVIIIMSNNNEDIYNERSNSGLIKKWLPFDAFD